MRIFLAAILWTNAICVGLFAPNAWAEAFNLGNATLEFPSEDGECTMPLDSERAKNFFNTQASAELKPFQVRARCKDLAAFNLGSDLETYRVIGAALDPLTGNLRYAENITRRDIAEPSRRTIEEASDRLEADSLAKANKKIEGTGASVKNLKMRVWVVEDDVPFLAISINMQAGQLQRGYAAVTSLIFMHGYMVTDMHLAPYVSEGTYDELLDQARKSAKLILAANPNSEGVVSTPAATAEAKLPGSIAQTEPTPKENNRTRNITIGLIIIVIGVLAVIGVIVLIVSIVRNALRKKSDTPPLS